MTLVGDGFSVSFSDREVTAWGGLALLKRMLDVMEFRKAMAGWVLPAQQENPKLALTVRYDACF
ncbi:MAG: hypothetical protein ABSB19_19760 [Methylomonas sp.]